MTATGQTVSIEIALDNISGFQRVHFPSEFRNLLYVQWQQGDNVTDNPHMFDNVVLYTADFRVLFLHGSGGTANPTSLSLSEVSPTATTAVYKDSSSITFSGGNLWREIGTWTAPPEATTGAIETLGDLHVWLGLKNSDDQGTRFDLCAELYKSDQLMASNVIRCITGITRNPNNATEVTVPFDSFTPAAFDGSTEVLRLRLLTRIGTNTDDTKCATGHGSAAGLRLYFDGINRASQFGATIP